MPMATGTARTQRPPTDARPAVSTGHHSSLVLMRRLLGDVLRRRRTSQGRTLREVAAAARVSLGYLSEVERGRKEASSELLASICGALGVPMSAVMREVSDELARAEAAAVGVMGGRDAVREGRRSPADLQVAGSFTGS